MAVGVKRDGGFTRFCVVPEAQVHELVPRLHSVEVTKFYSHYSFEKKRCEIILLKKI